MWSMTNNQSLAVLCGLLSLVALYFGIRSFRLSQQVGLLKTQLQVAQGNQELAFYDFLTGLLNRRGWDRAMQMLVPSTRPQTLVMLDLDQFKQTNDRYGHRTGDRVLKEFADRLRIGFETSDSVLARVGGEEFAIFSAQPLERLNEKVELWLETLRGSPFRDGQHSIVIRCSLGVAQRTVVESIEEWQDRADRALYEAKESGGNCVRLARSLP
ncbi:MAG: GGDEF domain-containing protein [Pirellula sp.]|jgi:diguanylate cyclase (GGDEF)-like protein|nr:GGDEF domain-containing protein [Pirellula sp.]